MKIILNINCKIFNKVFRENVIKTIEHFGYDVQDVSVDEPNNYAVEGVKVAENVMLNKLDLGIIIDDNACGIVMVANKIIGVRCVNFISQEKIALLKWKFNPNVIVIPAILKEKEIIEHLKIFLKAKCNNDQYNHELVTISDYEISCRDC